MDRTQYLPAAPRLSNQPLAHLGQRLLARLALWQQRARTRRQLAQLDVRLLADAGISPAARTEEVAKPFWRE